MKKILLAGTALVGVATLATPAHADLKLDLGGYFRGYAVYADNDETSTGAVDSKLSKFGFQKDAEVHFTGETTTDMGLTVGAHFEVKMLGQNGNFDNTGTSQIGPGTSFTDDLEPSGGPLVDESYAYFSGGCGGRVNFGAEDGAAYLLQVAAPSADSNVDGLRPVIQGFTSGVWADKSAAHSSENPFSDGNTVQNFVLGYDNADFTHTDRITYLTPKWSGFQAGVSYAPNSGLQQVGQTGMPWSNTGNNVGVQFKNLWEASARWDGEFSGVGISAGAGYSSASADNKAAIGTNEFGGRNLDTWDAGLNFTWQGWSLGGAYKWSNTGTSGANTDDRTWDIGLGWDNGPWHAGASWYNTRFDENAFGDALGTSDSLTINRYTVGGGYTYGPGMSFRGAVSWMNVDTHAADEDQSPVQITLGTDINF